MSLKIRREAKIGIFTVVTVLLFVWGLNFLKGKDVFSRQISYFAIYDDVTGLIASNPVSLSGVQIGQVKNISFLSDGSGKILVESIVERSVPIPANSVSMLTGMSLTGTREIIIKLGDASELITNGDTLRSGLQASIQDEVSQLVTPIRERAEELFGQIDSVMIVFQAIFNEETRRNITGSFSSIQQTLENLESTTGRLDETIDREATRIDAIMANAESISKNLKNNNENLSNILSNFSEISDTLAAANISQTMDNAEQSIERLSHILQKIETGEGTLGMLVNDENLYQNLEASSKELELLLEDIRQNPGRYFRVSVFGR